MSCKQFFILVEETAEAAFAVNTAGCISAWNVAAVQLFGVTAAEAIGTRCHQLLQCADENGPVRPEHCLIERAAHNKYPKTSLELRLQTKIGRQWCNLFILSANDASGARHAIHIVQPCERWKRLELALNEFVKMKNGNGTNGNRLLTAGINAPLTAREVEVLRSLAKGDSTKTIAAQFNISSATVNNHIKHILNKLDAHTRLEAIRYAESVGVI